jgi:hypothetical protein
MKHCQDHKLTGADSKVHRVWKVPDPYALYITQLEAVPLRCFTGKPDSLIYRVNEPAT